MADQKGYTQPQQPPWRAWEPDQSGAPPSEQPGRQHYKGQPPQLGEQQYTIRNQRQAGRPTATGALGRGNATASGTRSWGSSRGSSCSA